MSFWGELKRRNVFKVAVAYLVASWLIVQVVGVLTEPLNLPDVLDTVVVVLLAIGFPFALVIAWIYDVTPEGIRVTSSAGGAVSTSSTSGQRLSYVVAGMLVIAVVLMAIDNYVLRPSSDDFGVGSRLAILPCTDLSPDPTNAYFADGIHAELITRLGLLRGLDVVSRASVLRYADGLTPIPQVAEELDVPAVMECLVSYSGNQVRITAQVMDGATDGDLWGDVYRTDLTDLGEIFEIQATIAMQVANALRIAYFDDERERIERVLTESREAYEFYLEGLALDQTSNYRRVIELMDQAIGLDSEFAEAWSRKSLSHSLGFIGEFEDEATAMLVNAMQAAQRAIELAPNPGHGYAARAQAKAIRYDWQGAEQDYQTARELGYSSLESSVFLLSVGYFERARTALELVLATDARHPEARAFLPVVHELLRNFEAADTAYRQGRQLFPDAWFGYVTWSTVYLGRGESDFEYEASLWTPELAELLELPSNDDRLALLTRMASAPQVQRRAPLANYAVWAASFGDPEYALQLFERAVSDTGSGLLMYLAWLPVFDDVRQLEGFRDLVNRIGLVDYWKTRGWPDICRPLGDDDFVCS